MAPALQDVAAAGLAKAPNDISSSIDKLLSATYRLLIMLFPLRASHSAPGLTDDIGGPAPPILRSATSDLPRSGSVKGLGSTGSHDAAPDAVA